MISSSDPSSSDPSSLLQSRGRRLAAYLGLEFVSVLALVEEAELLVYGYLKTDRTVAAKRSSAIMSIQDLTHLSK